MKFSPLTKLSDAANGLEDIRVGVIIRPEPIFPELVEQRNGSCERSSFCKGFNHDIVDEQRWVLDVVEDCMCIVKVSNGGVSRNGHELVESVSVLLQASREYEGLNLLQLPHGFAGFEKRNTCSLYQIASASVSVV